ncbi:MAG: IS481 family transposase, partial [Bifidobacteriaceae bacterium]|nr:IS481 family transposase [Bifidobacteriaceae bacterium]
MTTFCAEHSISRKTFYALLARARRDGPAAVLEASGLDCGPISVLEKMRSMGIEPVPSAASLARIFRAAGVARLEPKKKPRAPYRRAMAKVLAVIAVGGLIRYGG